MAMDNPTETHNRRVEDLIQQVLSITQEVNEFLKGGSNRAPHLRAKEKRELEMKQVEAMQALQQAIIGQRELLKGMEVGKPVPQRRASDVEGETRQQPKLRTVEDLEIADIKRLAGITEKL